MLRKSVALFAGVCLMACASPVFAQITYTSGATSVGTNGSYTLSVTTDGTLGALSTGNVTDFLINISDSHGMFALTPVNADFLTSGGLSATATDLLFDFNSGGFALFQNPTTGSGQNFLCFASSVCGANANSINLLVGANFSEISQSPMQGNVVIASVSAAVPEPSTWAMMLVGFGMVGASIRYRRRPTKVAYA